MGRQIFVVYETDQWHSITSRNDRGVFTSKRAVVNAIVKHHNIDVDEIVEDDETNPLTQKQKKKEAERVLRAEFDVVYQTQGYSINYEIEVWNINEWFD